MTRQRPIITCKHCGKQGPQGGLGYIISCYTRWRKAGRPETGPPDYKCRRSRIRVCECCGETKRIQARGYCSTCYSRARRRGFPDEGPPKPGVKAKPKPRAAVRPKPAATPKNRDTAAPQKTNKARSAALKEDYRFLREHGVSVVAAAERVGINVKTAQVYERELTGE